MNTGKVVVVCGSYTGAVFSFQSSESFVRMAEEKSEEQTDPSKEESDQLVPSWTLEKYFNIEAHDSPVRCVISNGNVCISGGEDEAIRYDFPLFLSTSVPFSSVFSYFPRKTNVWCWMGMILFSAFDLMKLKDIGTLSGHSCMCGRNTTRGTVSSFYSSLRQCAHH
jgi:hypothetical protein